MAEATDAVAKSHLRHVQKRLVWMSDYEVTRIDQTEDPINHFTLFLDCNPTTFESAIKKSKWWNAMDDEIKSIERNDN